MSKKTPKRTYGDWQYRWECQQCRGHFDAEVIDECGPCPACGEPLDGGSARRRTARPIYRETPFTPPYKVLIGWEWKDEPRKQIRSVGQAFRELVLQKVAVIENRDSYTWEKVEAGEFVANAVRKLLATERKDNCLHDCTSGAGCSFQTEEAAG